MAGGIGPVKLLSPIVKLLRFGNEEKSKLSRVPLSFFPVRSISETELETLQRIPVQLQILVRLASDHESSKEDEGKLFFHLTRASPCLVVDTVARVNGSNERKKTERRW